MIANNLDPFEPTHPGELLKEEIESRNLSQKQLAADMGVSYSVLNDIVNGKRAVNTKFALLCEAAIGIPAHISSLGFNLNMICRQPNATNPF